MPDLLGCVAVVETLEEVLEHMQGAREMHVEGIRDGDEDIAEPTVEPAVVEAYTW